MLPGKSSGNTLVHIEDVTDGLLAVGDKGQIGSTYVIGGDMVTYGQMADLIEEVSGVRKPMMTGSGMVPLMKGVMTLVAALVPVPQQYHPETFAALNNVTWWVTHEKSRQELGYNPRSYQEGLRETILHEMNKLGISRPGGV